MNNKGSILIVDDKAENLGVLVLGLTQYGYQPTAVKSGFQALEAVQTLTPDLILLDILMPKMDGYTLCKELKQDERLRDVPVIFISALSEIVDKLKGFEVGGVDYLTKPLEFEEVIARADTHITLYRQRKEIERLLLEREKAEAAEHEQRLMVNALLDSAISMNSTLDLTEVLEGILDNVERVVAHDTSMIVLFDTTKGTGKIAHTRGLTEPFADVSFPLQDIDPVDHIRTTRQPLIITDGRTDPLWLDFPQQGDLRACLVVPIMSKTDILGMLIVFKNETNFYTQAMARHLEAFAIHASIAITNARLYEQSKQFAVLQERQRLAHELHDSVTQTLFSANTIAQSLPRILEKKPEKVLDYANDLAQLTRSAMAEMRSLLGELRPESLLRTEFGILLQQLTDAFIGKTGIAVTLNRGCNITLPDEVQMAFYRIAQEALNNIAKHTKATQVQVSLICVENAIELHIQDNGTGFDLENIASDHFGIKFMQERAVNIGADLTISTGLGKGTEIFLRKSKA